MTRQRLRAWGDDMREVHRLLRESLELARESIEDEPMADPLAGSPLLYCWGFCAALTGHHRSEENALFPYVIGLHPELRPVIDQLARDHHMIEHLIQELQRAVRADVAAEDKLRHLDGIDAVMETHFRYEERRLLGVLDTISDESLTAADLFGPLG